MIDPIILDAWAARFPGRPFPYFPGLPFHGGAEAVREPLPVMEAAARGPKLPEGASLAAVAQARQDFRAGQNADARAEARAIARDAIFRKADAAAHSPEVVAAAEASRASRTPSDHGRPHKRGGAIMVQLSDIHFGGTVVAEPGGNVYNFRVAAARLAAYAQEVLFYGEAFQTEELVIALTGDIFDSKIGKMRTDKMLHAESTACAAYQVGSHLIQSFIEELRLSEVFGSIRIHGIAGNEARLYPDRGFGHLTAAENWDSLLNGDLAIRYAGSDVVTAFGVNNYVAEVQGWRVLMVHGDAGLSSNLTQKEVQSLLGIHGADFGISGHIHDPYITGKWCRTASLIGTDNYAGEGLGLSGRASQNLYHLQPGRRNTIICDLQDEAEGVTPYRLHSFNGALGPEPWLEGYANG